MVIDITAIKDYIDYKYFDKAKRISASYPDVPFPEGWKANLLGVDLNLNYPAKWLLPLRQHNAASNSNQHRHNSG